MPGRRLRNLPGTGYRRRASARQDEQGACIGRGAPGGLRPCLPALSSRSSDDRSCGIRWRSDMSTNLKAIESNYGIRDEYGHLIGGEWVGGASGKTIALLNPATGETLARIQAGNAARSEEHTSELQSLMRNSYSVFCLK